MSPVSVMTTDTAAAKIGRSMKKCEKRTTDVSKAAAAARLPRQRQRAVLPARYARREAGDDSFLHSDSAAGPCALHAADDDAVLRLEPFRDHAQPVDQAARANDFLADDSLCIDDVKHLARLVGDDGLVRHEQRVERLQREQAQLPEHSG